MICAYCGNEMGIHKQCSCGATRQMQNWAVIHIDTNGLKPEDGAEILKIVVLDRQGRVVWNRLYKPTRLCVWPEAEQVNKISPYMIEKFNPLSGEETENLSSKLCEFAFLVCNQKSFIQTFLDAAKIKIPEIHSVNALFEHYLDQHNLPYQNPSLNNCASFFGLKEIPESMKGIEKAYKVWFCYQNLESIKQKDFFSCMNQKELCANGVRYKTFLNDNQVLDYLKCIKIADICDQEIPRLYYDGRYTPELTIDVFVLGLSLSENRTTTFVILAIKDRVVAVKESVFIDMQKRNHQKNKESEELISFDVF